MGETFTRFLGDHPFWAIFIAVFMVIPMIGAVAHIILKALGRKGIDNSPPSRPETSSGDEEGETADPGNPKQ